jgi:hypothetical protein
MYTIKGQRIFKIKIIYTYYPKKGRLEAAPRDLWAKKDGSKRKNPLPIIICSGLRENARKWPKISVNKMFKNPY